MPRSPAPLEPETYAPYGDVVQAGAAPGRVGNQGRARIWDHRAELLQDRDGARPNLAVFRTVAWPGDLVDVRLMERHPRSTQLFVPMTAARFLVIVAPPGPLDPAGIVAFVAAAHQGITYHPGVWHHPLIALDREADFTALVWEDGTPADCELVELPASTRPVFVIPPPTPPRGAG